MLSLYHDTTEVTDTFDKNQKLGTQIAVLARLGQNANMIRLVFLGFLDGWSLYKSP